MYEDCLSGLWSEPATSLQLPYGLSQDGQVAETKVKLRAGDTLVIDTVAGNVQLNFLRRFLNEGFQAHLQNNELLHQASSTLLAACL